MAPTLTTERLRLRHWTPADRAPFAALNADPVVMEHFPRLLSRAESDAAADRIDAFLRSHPYGLWAVETEEMPFIGFVGLSEPGFRPGVEVGWRLARAAWGRGYATEAARAALDHAFDTVGLGEVYSMTATTNLRSMRVMERLGMTRDPADDFDHPKLRGHPLERHVLYRVSANSRRAPLDSSRYPGRPTRLP